MREKLAVVLGSIFLAGLAQANTDPSSLSIAVFEMRVSEKTDCSESTRVFLDPSADPVDFVANPTFGSGSIPNKTYHCMMFHISDEISVVPEADVVPVCTAGQTYTQDIFNDPAIDVSIDPDGNTITGNLGTDEKPWIYFSDSPDSAAANGCYQPTKTSNGGPCVLSALDLQDDETKELVFNFDNKIGDANGSCGAKTAPSLSIR